MLLDKNYSSKSPTGVYFFNSNCIDSFSGHKKKKKKYKNKKREELLLVDVVFVTLSSSWYLVIL